MWPLPLIRIAYPLYSDYSFKVSPGSVIKVCADEQEGGQGDILVLASVESPQMSYWFILHLNTCCAVLLLHYSAPSAGVYLNQSAPSEGEAVNTPNPAGFWNTRQYLQSVTGQLCPSLRSPPRLRPLTWWGAHSKLYSIVTTTALPTFAALNRTGCLP